MSNKAFQTKIPFDITWKQNKNTNLIANYPGTQYSLIRDLEQKENQFTTVPNMIHGYNANSFCVQGCGKDRFGLKVYIMYQPSRLET